MRVLVIGGTGLLGRALVEEWQADEVRATGTRDADVRDAAQVENLVGHYQPQAIVLLAVYSDVDGCEADPQLAQAVNCDGAANVARAAARHGARLLLTSTDYVFDGAKTAPYEVGDVVNAVNVYGRSKAEAEARVREILPDCCIVRTSWLFGTTGKCFPDTILRLAATQKELPVVSDQVGRPTFNRDLAKVLVRLVRAGATGTVHAANTGQCSWYEFAQETVRLAELREVTVKAVSSNEFRRPAARPRYSVLSLDSLRPYGITLRSWPEALRAYLEERSGMTASRAERDFAKPDPAMPGAPDAPRGRS